MGKFWMFFFVLAHYKPNFMKSPGNLFRSEEEEMRIIVRFLCKGRYASLSGHVVSKVATNFSPSALAGLPHQPCLF